MRIIYYSPHPTHDIVSEVGYSTHQRETIAAFRKLGHEVLPVILGGTEKAKVETFHNDIGNPSAIKRLLKRIIPLFLLNGIKDLLLIKHDIKAVKILKQNIDSFNPDLVYERGEYMQNKGTKLCKRLGIKHFLEINSPAVDEMRSFEGRSFLHFIGHVKEKSKIENTTHIFAVSTALKKYIVQQYHPSVPISIIPNCINPAKTIPTPEEIKDLREKLGCGNQTVFGFVGSIFPHHGIERLIEAFAIVLRKSSHCKLLIVGGGNLLPSYQNMATRLLPPDSFLFTGKIAHADVLKHIGVFDVAVMPDSNWYGSPVKILEYGIMKKTIIAPNYDPLRDIMTNAVDGILVEPGVDSLALAMTECLEKTRVNPIGNTFYNKIMASFTWEKQAEQILSN